MSLLRTSAPTRTPPPGVSAISVSGSALMSTTVRGRSTCSFIRSTSVVPPARYRAPADAAARAACSSAAATNLKGSIASAPPAAHRLHRRDDAGVGAAAADVSAHAFPNIVVVGAAGFLQQRDGRHDLSRRAVAALEAVAVDEGLLHRVEPIAFGEALDRRDRLALCRGRERQTRQDAAPADVHRAGAALAVIAAFLGSRQLQMLA